MTEQLRTKLLEHHKEELNDSNMYIELSEELEKEGMCKASGILKDIADEEEMHAQLIKHILNWEK